jgi:hypothetical protein
MSRALVVPRDVSGEAAEAEPSEPTYAGEIAVALKQRPSVSQGVLGGIRLDAVSLRGPEVEAETPGPEADAPTAAHRKREVETAGLLELDFRRPCAAAGCELAQFGVELGFVPAKLVALAAAHAHAAVSCVLMSSSPSHETTLDRSVLRCADLHQGTFEPRGSQTMA